MIIDLAKLRSVLPLAAALVLACGGQSSTPTEVVPAPAEATAIAKDAAPKIVADAPVFDFGAIKPTDTVEHVFKLRNVGTADLKVERVQKT